MPHDDHTHNDRSARQSYADTFLPIGRKLSYHQLAHELQAVGLFLLGFVCSVVLAMLLKILPFLAYMHIQQIIFNNFALADKLPTMHQLLPKTYGRLLLTTQLINLVAMFYWLMASTDILVFSIPLLVQFSILFLAIIYVWRKHNTISIELHSANSIA